jgi:hypothetical protein
MNEGTEKKDDAVCVPRANCRCPHHMAGPLIVIAIGVVMLLSVLGVLSGTGVGVTFSLIVIIVGISMIMKRTCRCCCK